MKSDKDKVIYFYEEEAKIYDIERFSTTHGRYMDQLQKDIVLSMINSWKNKRILEVGCGTGRFTIEIANQGSIIVGLDPSIPMLKKVKEKAKDVATVGIIDLTNGSGYELPFKDFTFDGCVCINVINHLPNYDKMFKEVYRVLKPNGFFIMNFSNMFSLFLPVALLVNLTKRSVINDVYTQWSTLSRMKRDLLNRGFETKEIKGDTALPAFIFPKELTLLLEKLNLFSRGSLLKYISCSIFIKAECDKK